MSVMRAGDGGSQWRGTGHSDYVTRSLTPRASGGMIDSRTRFALVLGGGGMKGLAHVGALVGAAWSAGRSVAELHDVAVALRRRDVFAVAHADMAFKRMRSPALFRREPLDALIGRLVGDVTFQELDRPLIVNTVDINSG